MEKVIPAIPTSAHWNRVRALIKQLRIDAHTTVVSKEIAQEIIELQKALGMDALEDMIKHEKRMYDLNVMINRVFWTQKDAQDEADYECEMAKLNKEREASNGI